MCATTADTPGQVKSAAFISGWVISSLSLSDNEQGKNQTMTINLKEVEDVAINAKHTSTCDCGAVDV